MAEETPGPSGVQPQPHHIEPRVAYLVLAGFIVVMLFVIVLSMRQNTEVEVVTPPVTTTEDILDSLSVKGDVSELDSETQAEIADSLDGVTQNNAVPNENNGDILESLGTTQE